VSKTFANLKIDTSSWESEDIIILKQISELKDKGIVTESEFNKKIKQIQERYNNSPRKQPTIDYRAEKRKARVLTVQDVKAGWIDNTSSKIDFFNKRKQEETKQKQIIQQKRKETMLMIKRENAEKMRKMEQDLIAEEKRRKAELEKERKKAEERERNAIIQRFTMLPGNVLNEKMQRQTLEELEKKQIQKNAEKYRLSLSDLG